MLSRGQGSVMDETEIFKFITQLGSNLVSTTYQLSLKILLFLSQQLGIIKIISFCSFVGRKM